MLCALCTTILLDSTQTNRRSDRIRHHHTFSDLQKAAYAGCKICWQILESMTTSPHGSETAAALPLPITCKLLGDGEGYYTMKVWVGKEEEEEIWFRLQAWEIKADGAEADAEEVHTQAIADVKDNPWRIQHRGSNPDYPSSTGDPAVAGLAERWLSDCQKDHKHCGNSKPTVYPKRLVDLGNGEPTLIETSNRKLRDPYATLSHCWGRTPFLTLTEKNLDEFMAGIPLERLPKSFQDAILTCQRLEIKYLWIDSLCIIQGEQRENEDWETYIKTLAYKDWEEHARTMADIYKNCLLNISIDRASNPYEGAFAERSPGVMVPDLVLVRRRRNINWRDGFQSPTHEPVYCTIVGPLDVIECIDRMPLSRRAWVFQERYLSPRVLHFGTDRIFWECCEISYGEGSLSDDHSIKGSSTFGSRFHQGYPSGAHWTNLVRNYSARSLTKPRTDKLVAFAAVAREIEEQRNDEYVVGLFQKDLPYALLWWVSKECQCTRPKDQAPSWSWACLNCGKGVSYIQRLEDAIAEIMDIDIQYVDKQNKYGMVSSGTLSIKGRMGFCLWNGKGNPNHDNGVLVTGIPAILHAGASFVQSHVSGYFDTEDDRVSHMGRESHFLLITPYEGLILTETETKGVYTRIGKGYFYDLYQNCRWEAFEEREIKIV